MNHTKGTHVDCIFCERDDSRVIKEDGGSRVVRCKWCGLVYRNPDRPLDVLPLVTTEEKAARFARAAKFRRAQRHIMDAALDIAEKALGRRGRLLDVGSGNGDMLVAAADRGWEVSGLDPSMDSVEICAEAGHKVFHGTLEELDPEPESFDAVTLFQVMDHFRNPLHALEQIFRILKPGGVLLVRGNNAPFHVAAHRIYAMGRPVLGRLGLGDPGVFHRFAFSRSTMEYCANRAGLRVLETRPSPIKKGDPDEFFGKSAAQRMAAPLASAVNLATSAAFAVSGGRWILSSSFLSLCRKEPAPDRVKLLRVITRMDKGGSAVYTAQVARLLDRDKYETHLICGSLDQFSDNEIQELKNSCGSFRVEPSLVRDLNPKQDLKAMFKLAGIMRRERFDIVHTHTSKAGFVGRLAAFLARVPIVVHSPHGHIFYGYFGPLKTKLFIVLERLAAKITDRICCLTIMGVHDHLDFGVGKCRQYRVVHSGVDIDKFARPEKPPSETRKELGIPDGVPVLGVAARLDHIKGVRYAVQALPLVKSGGPAPHLIVAGDGEEREELAEMAARLGVADRIHFLGQRNDVPDLLHTMDVFLLPSLNEGMGRVVVEAMSAGLPVVASNVGGVPVLVKDGETGYLVPSADPEAMAGRVSRLLENREEAKRMGAAGRTVAGEKFSIDTMIMTLEEIYYQLQITLTKV